ncbi:hypothetical protein FRB97_009249, partial [Tulasnella sp. 331]
LKRGSNNSFGDLLPADSGTESISGPRSSPSSAASSSDHDGPSSLNIKPFPVIQVEEISHVLNVILHIIYDISVASHGPSFDFLAETLPCLVRYGIPNPNPDGNSDFWALIMTYAPFYPFRVYALASAYDGGDPACTTASEHTLQRRLTEMTVDDASHMGGVRLWQLVRLHLDRTEALVGIITSPPGSHVPTNSCSADDQTALAQSWRLVAVELIAQSAPQSTPVDALINGFGAIFQGTRCDTCRDRTRSRITEVIRSWSEMRRTI